MYKTSMHILSDMHIYNSDIKPIEKQELSFLLKLDCVHFTL